MDENTNLEETTVADLARCFSARSLAALAKPWGPHSSERAKLERALCECAKLKRALREKTPELGPKMAKTYRLGWTEKCKDGTKMEGLARAIERAKLNGKDLS